ncbi:MAG: phosphotransferase, partial [Actinomycetes bacterium]
PFLSELRELLLDGTPLAGGNVGGAVRIGWTVRRTTGPWSPAVHAVLAHLEGFPCVPRLLSIDERGREVLTYLPGHVVDIDTGLLSEAQIVSVTGWVRALHEEMRGFAHPGPWRMHDGTMTAGEIICHNDVAPYNVCFEGDEIVGVFDWDMAGPNTPLIDLGFLAWNAVPLRRELDPLSSASRLQLIARTYGGVTAAEILHATVVRVEQMISGIRAGQAAGEPGILHLATIGEPGRTEGSLADLRRRMPAIEAALHAQ